MKKIKDYCYKHAEVIMYLIFGGLTTLVNLITYFTLAKLFSIDEVVSNIIAWTLSIFFAYVTNKKYVFKSRTHTRKAALKEMTSFFSFRIASGVLDISLFALCVKVLLLNDSIVKLVLQVVIIILNYLASKFVIFKKDAKK